MNWRWLILDYVPTELALTSEQRKQARKRMYQLRHRVPVVNWVLFLLGPVAGIVGCSLGYRWFGGVLGGVGLPDEWAKWLAAALILVGFTLAYAFILAGLYVGPMRRALREMGYDVCIKCEYWLRELPNDIDKCPECGAKREPMPPDSKGSL